MARSDLLVNLVEAERRGDGRVSGIMKAIISEERANQHHLVADRLSELITTTGSPEILSRDAGASRVQER